eukprot:GCRY01002713.1.p1 GENE.GCRY01002713.1~~GCRY01002713.1.p1  ORF type:complete len:180 (+),score=33.23 GCRY01002713.1:82-621(+)
MIEEVNIVFCGDSQTGKKSIAKRWLNQSFSKNYTSNEGCLTFQKMINTASNRQQRIQLHVCSGETLHLPFLDFLLQKQRNHALKNLIVCLVYDATHADTFFNTLFWFNTVERLFGPYVSIALVRTKTDLIDSVAVEPKTSAIQAQHWKCPEHLVSAKSGRGINTLFATLIEKANAAPRE